MVFDHLSNAGDPPLDDTLIKDAVDHIREQAGTEDILIAVLNDVPSPLAKRLAEAGRQKLDQHRARRRALRDLVTPP